KNAPHFDDTCPEDLLEFLQHVERMMEIDKTPAGEKNKFLVRYTALETGRQWRAFDSYSKPYTVFRKEVIQNYPCAWEHSRGTIRTFHCTLDSYANGSIEISDQDNLFKLIRALSVQVQKLLVPPA
ncbi:hypothetical protein C8F04DRAFT_924741, partial [Mycena alexandri]